MQQMDDLRRSNNLSAVEVKFLKDKMKVFECTHTQTEFQGFGAGIQKNTMNAFAANSHFKSPQ